jgi:chromosome segregation ATPase
MYEFPDELIKNVKFFRSASTESLETKIEEWRINLSTLKEQIDTDKSWKDEFKNGLSQNNEQILKLGTSLEDLARKLGQEIDERKQGEAAQKANYSVVKGIGLILGALVGGGLVSLIVMYLAGILNFG